MSLTWISRAQRLNNLPPYVFARLDELKARAREQGIDLIDLGMGNPDGSAPQPVIDAAIAAMAKKENHGYMLVKETHQKRKQSKQCILLE